jgi:copper chaperone CopZ
MNQITVKIDGMMCGMCESHVSDAIRKALPVKKVTASHTKGEAILLTESPITEAQLRAVIDPTGYRVLGVSTKEYEKRGILGLFRK